MKSVIEVRKVTQDVLLFVWFQNKIITKEQMPERLLIPEVSAELIDNLCISVWMESFRMKAEWEDFFHNYFKSITCKFSLYIAHAFYVIAKTDETYDYFFNVLSFITFLGVCWWQMEHKLCINECVDSICAFFEKEIRSKFEDRGGWKNLDEYLQKIYNLEKCKSLISENKSPSKYFETSQDEVPQNNKLQTKIKDVLMEGVAEEEMESLEKALSFANYVMSKISESQGEKVDDVLKDYAKTYTQVMELYQQTVGEASDTMAKNEKFLLPQRKLQEAPKNIPCKGKSEKKIQQKQTVTVSNDIEIQNSANMKSQGVNASDKVLLDGPKLERAKKTAG